MHATKLFIICISSSVQFFNYGIFGLTSHHLAISFFPGSSELEKLVSFFGSITLSAFIRPLASFIFGSMGDISGRRAVIIWSGIISNIGVLSVAFIPTFEDIGLLASLLIILARVIFLAGLTGDIDGIRVYISEIVPIKQQYTGNGLVSLFTGFGTFAASLCLVYFSQYIEIQFLDWRIESWRLFFFIGGITGLILSMNRAILPESPDFLKAQSNQNEMLPLSFIQIVVGHYKTLIYETIIFGSLGAFYYFYIIFLPPYVLILHGPSIWWLTPIYIFSYGIGGVFWAVIMDKYRMPSLPHILRMSVLLGFVILYFQIQIRDFDMIAYIAIYSCFMHSGVAISSYVFLKNQLNISVRCRVFSLSHSFGSLLISSPTNYICAKSGIVLGHEFIVIFPFICITFALLVHYYLENYHQS